MLVSKSQTWTSDNAYNNIYVLVVTKMVVIIGNIDHVVEVVEILYRIESNINAPYI